MKLYSAQVSNDNGVTWEPIASIYGSGSGDDREAWFATTHYPEEEIKYAQQYFSDKNYDPEFFAIVNDRESLIEAAEALEKFEADSASPVVVPTPMFRITEAKVKKIREYGGSPSEDVHGI